MSKNNVFLTTISVLVIFGFLFLVYAASNKSTPENATVYEQLQVPLATDHIKWAPNQKNVLVEFSDFQCPACQSFHQILKAYEASGSAEAKVASKITFVYKHFPLDRIHKNARSASFAAEAAGNQGKFFEMGDLLFENQKSWENSKDTAKIFAQYADSLDLDVQKFQSSMKSSGVKKRVEDDVILGNQIGVSSTPSFYLNGKLMKYSTLNEFNKLLADATK